VWLPSLQSIYIRLSPRKILVTCTARPWSRQPAVHGHLDVPVAPDADSGLAAATLLAEWLSQQANRKANVHVCLSGRLVRWQLLPPQPELNGSKELAAYAQLRFQHTFGSLSEHWQVRHSLQPPGQAIPACAIDTQLLESLRNACIVAGMKLSSVSSLFSTVFDLSRHSIKGKSAWFGLLESDCLTLGLLRNSTWVGLRSQRLTSSVDSVLPGLMAQISIPAGLEDVSLPFYLAGESSLPSPVAGLRFSALNSGGKSKIQIAGCHLALAI
jgi:hypothetical protein